MTVFVDNHPPVASIAAPVSNQYVEGTFTFSVSCLNNAQPQQSITLTAPPVPNITLVGGTVTPITGGFKVTGGTLTITGNGNAVFPNSTLEVDITGGSTVAHSNIVLKFTGDAAGHFGGQAIHGVVAFDAPPPGN